MDKRLTKTSIISTIVTLIIIVLAMGADEWFGIDLGIFTWIIFGVAISVNCFIVASQARKVEQQGNYKNTTFRSDIKSTGDHKMDTRVRKTMIAIVLFIVGIAVLAIFNWNLLALDLPVWTYIPSTIVGIPLLSWGITLLVLTNRKQK